MAELETRLHVKLFSRNHASVALTDAGRAFVEEAKLLLVHYERAIQHAKAAEEGVEAHLTTGHSPFIDPVIVSTLLSIDLPLYPGLTIHMQSDFAPELIHGLLTSKLDLAFITSPGSNRKLTTTKVSEFPFYIALREDDALARKHSLTLNDLQESPWILFDRKVHPLMHDLILRRAAEENVAVKNNQNVFSADEAFQLVQEGMGVAFITMTSATRSVRPGIQVRPLVDGELRLEVCLSSRADNASKLVSEFARAFMKRITQVLKPPPDEAAHRIMSGFRPKCLSPADIYPAFLTWRLCGRTQMDLNCYSCLGSSWFEQHLTVALKAGRGVGEETG